MRAAAHTDEVWDVVVARAGSAGSTAALGASRADPTLRVLPLDRADRARDACCGDGTAPHVLVDLVEIGPGHARATVRLASGPVTSLAAGLPAHPARRR